MNIKPIKTESDYRKALKRIEAIWEAAPDTKEDDELTILAVLVESYEKEHYKILPPDPVEAIKFRMDQMGLKQADLARYLGGRNRSTEVLNRKRGLSIRMIRELHDKLDIPAESLIAEPSPEYKVRKRPTKG